MVQLCLKLVGIAWFEVENHTVDAVAQSGRRWAVGEDVAEMCLTCCATDFGATHKERTVIVLTDRRAVCRLCVARPTCARIKLVVGLEQRLSATNTLEHASTLLVIEWARERSFRSVLTGDVVLFLSKLLSPLGI